MTFRDALAFRRHAFNGIHPSALPIVLLHNQHQYQLRCVHAGDFQLLGEVLPFRTSLWQIAGMLFLCRKKPLFPECFPNSLTKLGLSLLATRCMIVSRLQKGLPPEHLHPLRVLSGAPQQPHFVIASVFREAYVPRQHCASHWIPACGELFLKRVKRSTLTLLNSS